MMTSSDIEADGFALVPGVLGPEECERIRRELGSVAGAGRRGLLREPVVATLARSPRMLALVRPHLPEEPLPVRAIYFDKSAGANWLVPWHQDLTLAVQERAEAAGFGPWSIKDGVPHVQPPVDCLRRMLTIRLHLDDADAENGALRVLPGSHAEGRIDAGRIQEIRSRQSETLCAVPAGGVLLMRPLLLHASGRSTSERHRRILHLEYAAFQLPSTLRWHEAV